MKESTRRIIKMHGWRIDRAVHNYIYFVYYRLYVKLFLKAGRWAAKTLGGLKIASRTFGMVFERYHAKVITINEAGKLLSLKSDLALGPDYTKKVIPYKYANKIILEEPEFIAVMDCPCRLSREKHCEPVNVCIAVGRTTASFWLEHCAHNNARKITQKEALEIIKKGRERGEITTAWFKVATGGRTGVICSCCSCCCGGLEANRIVKQLKYGSGLTITAPSGYVVQTDYDKCDACGKCIEVCGFSALSKGDNGKPRYDVSLCMGCGLCAEKCPSQAKQMVLNPEKGYPLDVDWLREEWGKN